MGTAAADGMPVITRIKTLTAQTANPVNNRQ
jgi:hypothetical protein